MAYRNIDHGREQNTEDYQHKYSLYYAPFAVPIAAPSIRTTLLHDFGNLFRPLFKTELFRLHVLICCVIKVDECRSGMRHFFKYQFRLFFCSWFSSLLWLHSSLCSRGGNKNHKQKSCTSLYFNFCHVPN